MANISQVVRRLRRERQQVQQQLQRIDEALAALGSSSNGSSRTMSAAGRRRISLARKARWAKQMTAKCVGRLLSLKLVEFYLTKSEGDKCMIRKFGTG